MPVSVIVPLRDPGRGKTRLRGVLDREERARLSIAMFADVVDALLAASIDELVVAAQGAAAVRAARAVGVDVVTDPPGTRSLDTAVAAAAQRLPAGTDLLVVAADLPRLTTGDVAAVLGRDTRVVIAPTSDGGTGGLLRRPRTRTTTAYGQGSAAEHERLAREAGSSVSTVLSPGYLEDVDTGDDLVRLVTASGIDRVGEHTRRMLDGWPGVARFTNAGSC